VNLILIAFSGFVILHIFLISIALSELFCEFSIAFSELLWYCICYFWFWLHFLDLWYCIYFWFRLHLHYCWNLTFQQLLTLSAGEFNGGSGRVPSRKLTRRQTTYPYTTNCLSLLPYNMWDLQYVTFDFDCIFWTLWCCIFFMSIAFSGLLWYCIYCWLWLQNKKKQKKTVLANFVLKFPNFRYHGNKGLSEANFDDAVKLPDPENPSFGANSLLLSLKMPEL